MAFISPDFDRQIQQKPQAVYPVLITLKGSSLPPGLSGKGKFILAGKVFSARISGQEIQSFVHHNEIEAIEPDVEMGTMF